MTARKTFSLAGGAVVLAVLAGAALTQVGGDEKNLPDQPADMTFSWVPSTEGTTPVRYNVHIRVGGKTSTDIRTEVVTTNQITFPVEWLTEYEVQVQAVDAAGRMSGWSAWSDPPVDRDLDVPEDLGQ